MPSVKPAGSMPEIWGCPFVPRWSPSPTSWKDIFWLGSHLFFWNFLVSHKVTEPGQNLLFFPFSVFNPSISLTIFFIFLPFFHFVAPSNSSQASHPWYISCYLYIPWFAPSSNMYCNYCNQNKNTCTYVRSVCSSPFCLHQFPTASFFKLATWVMTCQELSFILLMTFFPTSDPTDSTGDTFDNFPCMLRRERPHWNPFPDRVVPHSPHPPCCNHPLDMPGLYLPIHPPPAFIFPPSPAYEVSIYAPGSLPPAYELPTFPPHIMTGLICPPFYGSLDFPLGIRYWLQWSPSLELATDSADPLTSAPASPTDSLRPLESTYINSLAPPCPSRVRLFHWLWEWGSSFSCPPSQFQQEGKLNEMVQKQLNTLTKEAREFGQQFAAEVSYTQLSLSLFNYKLYSDYFDYCSTALFTIIPWNHK